MSHKNLHTSTFDARKTQVGAMSTGSILFREYLQVKKTKTKQQQQTKTGLRIYNVYNS